jgi:hypothetical protein
MALLTLPSSDAATKTPSQAAAQRSWTASAAHRRQRWRRSEAEVGQQ